MAHQDPASKDAVHKASQDAVSPITPQENSEDHPVTLSTDDTSSASENYTWTGTSIPSPQSMPSSSTAGWGLLVPEQESIPPTSTPANDEQPSSGFSDLPEVVVHPAPDASRYPQVATIDEKQAVACNRGPEHAPQVVSDVEAPAYQAASEEAAGTPFRATWLGRNWKWMVPCIVAVMVVAGVLGWYFGHAQKSFALSQASPSTFPDATPTNTNSPTTASPEPTLSPGSAIALAAHAQAGPSSFLPPPFLKAVFLAHQADTNTIMLAGWLSTRFDNNIVQLGGSVGLDLQYAPIKNTPLALLAHINDSSSEKVDVDLFYFHQYEDSGTARLGIALASLQCDEHHVAMISTALVPSPDIRADPALNSSLAAVYVSRNVSEPGWHSNVALYYVENGTKSLWRRTINIDQDKIAWTGPGGPESGALATPDGSIAAYSTEGGGNAVFFTSGPALEEWWQDNSTSSDVPGATAFNISIYHQPATTENLILAACAQGLATLRRHLFWLPTTGDKKVSIFHGNYLLSGKDDANSGEIETAATWEGAAFDKLTTLPHLPPDLTRGSIAAAGDDQGLAVFVYRSQGKIVYQAWASDVVQDGGWKVL